MSEIITKDDLYKLFHAAHYAGMANYKRFYDPEAAEEAAFAEAKAYNILHNLEDRVIYIDWKTERLQKENYE